MVKIFGILNLTEDSFSDGSEFLDFEKAKNKAIELFKDGADVIDLGAQSSNISSIQISPEEEWHRLEKMILFLQKKQIPISVDTFKPFVIEKSILAKVDYINNINGFENLESMKVLEKNKNHLPNLISMYSHNLGGIAIEKSKLTKEIVIDEILFFFRKKKNEFIDLNISLDKLIFDTGMGFFLSPDFEISLEVIKKIEIIQKEFPNLFLSVSRKSFIGNLLGGISPKERDIGTLIFELELIQKKIPYIRTHNVKQLKQALKILGSIKN